MRRFFVILFLFIFSPISQASIAVEPFFGLGIGYFNNFRSGYSIGSRLGYSRWGLMSGVDVSFSRFSSLENTIQLKPCSPSNTRARGLLQLDNCKVGEDANINQSDVDAYNIFSFGPSVSFGLPLIIDAYASLTWSWATTSVLPARQFFLAGPGIKVGASYLSLPFLRINLELQAIYLQCADNDDLKECQKKTKLSTTMPVIIGQAYVSVPISTGFL